MSADNKYPYTELGQGPTILILHGLFGSLSNFEAMMQIAKHRFRFILPYLPLYDCELKNANLEGMLCYLKEFVDYLGLTNFAILGNSFGGHLGMMYTLQYPEKVNALILTASSGLFENSLGNEYPKRDRDFLKSKILETFGNKSIVTEELVSEVETIVNSKSNAIRIIKLAKSATRQNLIHTVNNILHPCLLIWGEDDTITPPFVAEKFHQLLPHSQLIFLPKCGHAPMMEYPKEFCDAFIPFLDTLSLDSK